MTIEEKEEYIIKVKDISNVYRLCFSQLQMYGVGVEYLVVSKGNLLKFVDGKLEKPCGKQQKNS